MGSKTNNTLLWQISGDSLPGTSYLFGTMHVKDQKAFANIDEVYACIRSCNCYASEFDLDEMTGPDQMHLFFLPNGQTLDQLIRPKVYQKLERIFRKALGIELSQFRHQKPLIVSNIINELILSSDMPHSLDEHLWKFAKSKDRNTLGIETLAEQTSILQKIPLSEQVRGLIAMGRNFSKHRKSMLQMTEVYQRADLRQLHKAGARSAQGFKKLLLFDRNELMANRIAVLIQKDTLFCSIGAGHLGGKKGVLRLLKLKGFRVRPV